MQQALLVQTFRQSRDRVGRALGGNVRLAPRVVERAAAGHRRQDRVEMLLIALLNAITYQFALFWRAVSII